MRRHPEDDLQRAVCAFLDRALVPPAFYFAVPNGGKRNAREAARMKAMGVKAGAPDLLIFGPQPHKATTFCRGEMVCIGIELKAGKGRITKAQDEMAARFDQCRSIIYECRTLDNVVHACRAYGIAIRARPT